MVTARLQLLRLFFAAVSWLPSTVNAGDGPQNTGSLILSLAAGQDQRFEAQLQMDRKVLKATFGEDSSPDALLQMFSLELNERPCKPGTPSVIDSDDVVTAALEYQCSGAASYLTITLSGDRQIPEGFTLGVRTPFDHFVLSRADGLSRATITSGGLLFFRAGLAYFTGGHVLEQARIGRAHALYYGGLAVLPAGSWLLLLVLAIWCADMTGRGKVLMSAGALLLTGLIAALVMQKQASLALVPVRPLGFVYLGLLSAAAGAAFINADKVRRLMQPALLILSMIASGLEHAVILRWLEGQEQLSITALTAAFFGGAAITLTLIVAGTYLMAVKTLKQREFRRNRILATLPQLVFIAWPAAAMLLKWV